MKNHFLALFLLFLFFNHAHAQKRQNFIKRYINSLINDTSDVSKPQYLIYPAFGYAPETSLEIGLSNYYVYYQNRDTVNRLSQLHVYGFFTLENQYGIWVDHNLYTDENKWYIAGRARYQSYPMRYFGIGPDSPPEYQAIADALQFLFKERILRKTYENLYVGLNLEIQKLSSVDFLASAGEELPLLPPGGDGSTNVGIGVEINYDNRYNAMNVRDGFYSGISVIRYDDAFGSDFSFTSVQSDIRIFRSTNARNVIAAQVFGNFNFGDVPFNQMSLMGGEMMMRGYYSGRYRDKNELALQVEYRMLPLPFTFTKRWGATVFTGMGEVFDSFDHMQFNQLVVAGGAGIRFLLFPKKDIYSRLDVAFTEDGPGFYIFMGEAF